MDLFHKIMALIDKNSGNIPEGDYLQLCDTIHALREHVKPPSFLDQSTPMLVSDHDPERDGPLIYEPTRTRQLDWAPQQLPYMWMDDNHDTATQSDRLTGDDEEVMYPGLNQFLHELHEEWSDPVEPGAYYPPPRQGMHQDVEVSLSE